MNSVVVAGVLRINLVVEKFFLAIQRVYSDSILVRNSLFFFLRKFVFV